MKAIIFGVNGQDGYYLSRLLEKAGVSTVGISRSGAAITGSVSDFLFVKNVIKEVQPDYIFHLAANSSTRHEALFENHETISSGTLNILESVKEHCRNSVVFLSGSAMQFLNNGQPIDENTPFHASSPYSVARIQSTYAARYYREKFGLKVYVGYFFNHDSPLRSERHVNQKIAEAVKRIKKGSNEKLYLGNIATRKEFSFAGDVVKAIWILVNQNRIFEAVIGSGKAYSIEQWVEYCFKKADLEWRDFVSVDTSFTAEYDVLVCNPKLIFELGWKPETSFFDLANMMLGEDIAPDNRADSVINYQ